MRDWQKKALAWGASAVIVAVPAVLAIWMAGCAPATSAPTKQELAAQTEGAGLLSEDQKQITVLGNTLQMCSNGVQDLLTLCPHVPKSMAFDAGIKACLKEAQANQKK